MKSVLMALIAAVSFSVNAQVIARIEFSDGKSKLEFYSDTGPCMKGARVAVFTDEESTRILGCWIVDEDDIQIAFLDGKADRIPKTTFQAKPNNSSL